MFSIAPRSFTEQMVGSVCDNEGCYSVQTDPETAADLKQEQIDVNNAIQPWRFYPILKTGLSWRLGRTVSTPYWR